MMFLPIVTILLAVVLIVDLSGFVQSLKRFISLKLTKNKMDTTTFSLKPFDCSFCMTFWCSLLYITIAGQLTLVNILFALLCAYFSDVVKQFLIFVKDLCIKVIDKLYEWLI